MISVQEADRIIQETIQPFPSITIPLKEAYGCVLHEDIRADRDLPPFHKSLMDGIALKVASYERGVREFKIQGVQAAGQKQLRLSDPGHCIEIMTGAVLPYGCDLVIPIEYVNIEKKMAKVQDDIDIQKMNNIRRQGSDCKEGELLLERGNILRSSQIAVAASVGKAKISVAYKPKVAIISTGDELVEIDKKVKPFQIRQSNSYAVHSALLNTQLFEAQKFHVKDDKGKMTSVLRDLIKKFDVLVLSGGVSMGKFDYVPQVMKKLGVEVLFHKVKQKPGKPFWFGKTKKGQPVFALPGNPGSTQVGCARYVIEHLTSALGIKDPVIEHAVLQDDVTINPNLTFFLNVQLKVDERGMLRAYPVTSGGSGDIPAFGRSDGFIELPAGQEQYSSGFVGRLYRWS